MRKLLITILIALFCAAVFAQSAASIRKDNSYIYAEGTAGTTGAADSVALDALTAKLAQGVDLPYSLEIRKRLMGTYSGDIKRECGMVATNGRGKAYVMRYIQRKDVDRIFDGRRGKVKEMLSIASTADRKCQMDVALRYYSWAETLMRSLPSPDAVAIAEAKSRREDILKGLNVEFDRQDIYDKGIAELTFTYNGTPVKNIDYKFFDGKTWSNVLSAKDGKGFVEVTPGSRIDQYRIKYEITPAHLQHLFREVSLVEKALDSGTKEAHSGQTETAKTASESSARKIDFSAVKKKVLDVVAREEFQSEPDSIRGELAPVVFSSEYEDIVLKVCKGITNETDESVSEYFTPDGYDIFNRLIRYGNARVLSFGEMNFYELGNEVYARSVPMVFSFKGNKRQFVENIVFTFNEDKKICNLSFSLDKETVQGIVNQGGWSEEARIILISFLENYKTAYALKRLDYISSIFDDDALIITGRVLRNVKGPNEYSNNRYVTLTRQNKTNYIKNLSRVFASQEYINLQFSDCEVMKLGKGEQLFGIKIRQEYFSTTYSDTGYLFILVDLRDYQKPVIHVRTWQEAPDKDFGVIGPYNFKSMKRFAVIFILLFAAVPVLAQTDSSGFFVQSFKKLEWDLDARSNYPVLDQNNRKAALIKVVIPEVGFDFDVGVMGVVGVKQEVGEVWVYVPEGVRKITVRHQTYGIIRDYEFGCPIESAAVYEMRLHVPSLPKSTVIVKDSIVYVPTPVNVETPRVRKQIGIGVLAIGSVPDLSGGFMVVWNPKRFGAYLKATDNLKSSHYSYICHEDGTTDGGYIWTDGKGHVAKMTVTAGGLFRCLDWLSVSAGAGYGKRTLLWKDTRGNFAKVSEASAQGIAADLGAVLHWGRTTAYTGISVIGFKRLYPEIGVGFVF